MTRHTHQERPLSERRKFERVDIAYGAQILVLDKGKRVGVLRQIGRGGFMMEPVKPYNKDGRTYRLTIHEQEEDIRVEINARILYADDRFAGFEFVDLDPDSAVEVGIIIGKYYEANQAGA
jgi:PilZ domain